MPRLSAKMKVLVEETMRNDIIDASVAIIIAEGVEALTTDKLAEKLGIARGTLYNYFVNKDDIIRSLCERNFNAFLKAIDHIAGQTDAAEVKLRKIAEYMIEDFSAQRRLHTALMANPPPKHTADFRKKHQLLLDKITAIIKDGVTAGTMKATHPKAMAIIYFGALRELCFSHTVGLLPAPPRQLLKIFVATVLQAMQKKVS